MSPNSGIQAIASESAKVIVQEFLQTLPDELVEALPEGSLDDITTDLESDLRSYVNSRLQWTAQSARAEILEQQRQKDYQEATDQQNLVNLQLLQKLSKNESKKRRPHSVIEQPRLIVEKPPIEDKPIDLGKPSIKERSTDVDKTPTHEPDPTDYWTQLLANKEANRNRKRRRRSAS